MELMEELVEAYSDNSSETRYYLDIETGEVVVDLDESLFDDPESDWDENENIDRYLEVPKVQSSDAYILMQEFTKQVEDEETKKTLMDALNKRKPFRHFKDTLYDTGLRDEWFAYEYNYFKGQVLDWLDVEELSYDDLNEKHLKRNEG